jgi:hypothetical protein
MATPIREATLTWDNEPNLVAEKIQAVLDERKCLINLKSGARKGQACGGELLFDAEDGMVHCQSTARHSKEAWQDPYEAIIQQVIDSVTPEEKAQMQAIHDETYGRHAAQEEAQRLAGTEKRHHKLVEAECEALGLEVADAQPRPDGPAPEGTTWSFRLGEWVEPERLKKRPRTDA